MKLADGEAAVPAPAGLAAHLPAIDPTQAAWAHTLARCLKQALPGGRPEVAALSGADEFYIGAALAWRPGPALRAPLGADGARLADVLDRAEDWLQRIEDASGLAAEFVRHGPLAGPAVAVRLHAAECGGDTLLVPLAPPAPVPASAPQVAALAVVATRLSLEDAEALSAGDLLLLEAGTWPASVERAGLAAPAILFDPATGRLSPSRLAPPPQENTPLMATEPHTALRVPVTLRLPDLLLPQEALGTLAAGGTLELGPLGEGLWVDLAVAGRYLARGELVTVGDRFAVLIADPADPAPPPPLPPQDDGEDA